MHQDEPGERINLESMVLFINPLYLLVNNKYSHRQIPQSGDEVDSIDGLNTGIKYGFGKMGVEIHYYKGYEFLFLNTDQRK